MQVAGSKPKRINCRTAILLIALSALPDMARGQPHDVVQSLRDNEAEWGKDFARKDVESVVGHYAKDADLLLPQNPPVSGHAAIRSVYRQMIADPAFSLRFAPTKVVVSRSGDLGFTEGTYQLSVTNPKTKQVMNTHGNYVTTYRRTADGSWKALVDAVLEDASSGVTARP